MKVKLLSILRRRDNWFFFSFCIVVYRRESAFYNHENISSLNEIMIICFL